MYVWVIWVHHRGEDGWYLINGRYVLVQCRRIFFVFAITLEYYPISLEGDFYWWDGQYKFVCYSKFHRNFRGDRRHCYGVHIFFQKCYLRSAIDSWSLFLFNLSYAHHLVFTCPATVCPNTKIAFIQLLHLNDLCVYSLWAPIVTAKALLMAISITEIIKCYIYN